MNSIYRNLALGILIALVAGIGLYSFTKGTGPVQSPTASTTTYTLPDGTVITIPEGATVNELPDTKPAAQAPKAPDYRAAIVYDATVSAEVRAVIEAQFAQNKAQLAKDSHDFNAWMNLAVLHKIGGDYVGAATIWIYATKVWPTSPIAYKNLVDLYTNFLKDPAKAKFYADQSAKLQAQP